MIWLSWNEVPAVMRNESVKAYYDLLSKRRGTLMLKRLFDISVSFILLILLSPVFILLAIAIKLDSKGPVFFRQKRVTQWGREFLIFKFRSMVSDAEKRGPAVTTNKDSRITKVGSFIRKYRLDELCQLIDVFRGTMTFVGTRPEVPKYVALYTDEMKATLLLPAGVTSKASIAYKDEEKLLALSQDTDKTYMEEVLPRKMEYNLRSLRDFSLWQDICTMVRTVISL